MSVADAFGIPPDCIEQAQLSFVTSRSLRRRGVETQVIIGNAQAMIDRTLLRNIAHARDWYEQIISGRSFAAVAKATGIDGSQIKQMIPLAFLAPDILAQITTGKQPIGFTSEWVKTNTIPADWDAQRTILKPM